MIDCARLRKLMSYDPETGVFVWLVNRTGSARAGSVAGTVSRANGYREIKIDGRSYKAGRLAFLYVHGRWPAEQIDHADLNRSNDRIANLREASQSLNLANRPKWESKSGYRGVYPHGNKWIAKRGANGTLKYLGLFATKIEAARAYNDAAIESFGDFATVNEI